MDSIELQKGAAPDRGAGERPKLVDGCIKPENGMPRPCLHTLMRPISRRAYSDIFGMLSADRQRDVTAPQSRVSTMRYVGMSTRSWNNAGGQLPGNTPTDPTIATASMTLKPSRLPDMEPGVETGPDSAPPPSPHSKYRDVK